MEVQIVAINLYRGPELPNLDILAYVDLTIGDDLILRRCALAGTEDGFVVFPPKGRRSGETPVGWRRKGQLATDINKTAIAAFEAMTGRRLA